MQNQEILKTIKAITKNEDCNFSISDASGNILQINKSNFIDLENLTFPKTNIDEDVAAFSDLACCYHLFHHNNLHQKLLAQSKLTFNQKTLLNNLEKIRIILQSKDFYPGIFINILAKIDRDGQLTNFEKNLEIVQLLIIGNLATISNQFRISEYLEEAFFQIKQIIKPDIYQKIAFLINLYQEQEKFTELAIEIIKTIDDQDLFEPEEKNNQQQNKQQQTKERPTPAPDNHNDQSQNQDTEKQQEQPQTKSKAVAPPDQEVKETSSIAQLAQQIQEKEEKNIEFYQPYKVFTSNFDQVIIPNKITPKEELQNLSLALNEKISSLENVSKKLRLEFRKKLISKQNKISKQTIADGIIDRKKLSQIVTRPFDQSFYLKNQHQNYQNTTISILLDNSGSMRGKPIAMSAMACRIIAELLEEFNIKSEILGFTTADWKGGQSKKLWLEQCKPESPGRLNDIRHIIYKSGNQNFSKAQANLGLMLKEGFLRENIDGEAILWAKSRLMQSSEERKILIIISDGNPVDDSTNANNDDQILIDHLKHVISKTQKDNKIELVAIGIGHDVGKYYRNAVTIKKLEDLGDVMIKKIIDLI